MIKTLFTIALIPVAIIGAGIIAASVMALLRWGYDIGSVIVYRIKNWKI
jgi:hypothetical protein